MLFAMSTYEASMFVCSCSIRMYVYGQFMCGTAIQQNNNYGKKRDDQCIGVAVGAQPYKVFFFQTKKTDEAHTSQPWVLRV